MIYSYRYVLDLAGVDPLETEDAHTSTSTRPKQQPFKTECKQLANSLTHMSVCVPTNI